MSGLSDNRGYCAKRLLENCGTVWFFEIREGQRVTYVVEHGDQSWRFGLFFSARGKYNREVGRQEREAKIPNGSIAATLEKRTTDDPEASDSAERAEL